VLHLAKTGSITHDAIATWQETAEFWSQWTCSACLRAYLAVPGVLELLPDSQSQRDLVLQFYMLQEAVENLDAELSSDRTDQLPYLLDRILDLLPN
jgi:hypothetical protein